MKSKLNVINAKNFIKENNQAIINFKIVLKHAKYARNKY